MSDTYILSFDPGKSSGIALGHLSSRSPYRMIRAWQLEGGEKAITEFVRENLWDQEYGFVCYDNIGLDSRDVVTISEKFTPLQHKGFNLTLDAVEPLVCEGALRAFGVMPRYPNKRWRRPQDMYLYGGNTLVEKKKAGRKFLKDNGMYLTGKSVGCKDAHDAQSAIWHGISYAVKVLQHRPTFDMVSDWLDKQD